MDGHDARRRLIEFRDLGLSIDLTNPVSIPKGLKYGFRAGIIEITPPLPNLDEPADDDYRIVYASWDEKRRRDVTDMTNEEFVEFMKSEP
jgi:hypothetical protein